MYELVPALCGVCVCSFVVLLLCQSLTTLRMEFEALEDEANAIHGDLWEQLNAGGQVNRATLHTGTRQ